jgi:hypothetical protein
MGHHHSKTRPYPPETITVHFTVLPERKEVQFEIDTHMTLPELKARLAKYFTFDDNHSIKYEFQDMNHWVQLEGPNDWQIARTQHQSHYNKKSKYIEPLHIRVTHKSPPLHHRRYEKDNLAVKVPHVRQVARARRVSVPIEVKPRKPSFTDSVEYKLTNDDLFLLIMRREEESRYLRQNNH